MALSQSDQWAANADAFASVSQNIQSQRAQIAQYAILNGATYLSNGKQNEAIKEFKKALAFDPQNATAHTNIGKIYQNQGKLPEAIKEFKSVAQNDRTSVTARNDLGNAYLQAKQYNDAEKEFKTAAKMDPINPLADYTLGLLYTQTSRYGDAEAQFKKVGKVSPRDGNVPYSLGVLYNKMGRPEDAAKQLVKSLTLKKDFAAANYELGAAYVALGDTDKAAAQLKILDTKKSSLANDLGGLLNKPKMVYIDSSSSRSFSALLGPRTPLWMLDPTLLTANASKKVTVAIAFSNEMDVASIMNPANWEISRAKSTDGGYYNSFMPTTSNEVSIPKRPFSVTYDPTTKQASVTFTVTQSSTINLALDANNQPIDKGATIDPSHLVFKFSGKDSSGRLMDTTGDQIDGYASKAF